MKVWIRWSGNFKNPRTQENKNQIVLVILIAVIVAMNKVLFERIKCLINLLNS